MAKLTVTVNVPLDPADAWAHASDLADYDKWLSIHEAWRSELPEGLSKGVELESVARVKGMRNRVRWVIDAYDPPKTLRLKGNGKGGVKINLVLSVAAAKSGGSDVRVDIDLGGAPLFGPIGSGVARALKGDIESSMKTFVELYA